MGLSKKIAYYRKSKNITQDALARQLGISNQAVSKWETDQSCPDVELLPKIADIFGITLDELFEREHVRPINEGDIAEATCQSTGKECFSVYKDLPWEDDGTLRAVLYVGHKLVKKDEVKGSLGDVCKLVTFCYEGPALNIESCFGVSCKDVEGDICAGNYVECGDVAGNVNAGNRVECEDVEGDVAAGNCVECADVSGDVAAGSRVECENVEGDVKSGNFVGCTDVSGNVTAEGNVMCGNVKGDVKAGGYVECGNVGGDVYHS